MPRSIIVGIQDVVRFAQYAGKSVKVLERVEDRYVSEGSASNSMFQ